MGNISCCQNPPSSEVTLVEGVTVDSADAVVIRSMSSKDSLDGSDRDHLLDSMSAIFVELFDGIFNKTMSEDELRKGFDLVDSNKDGTWDESEIRTFLKRMDKSDFTIEQLIALMPSSQLRLGDIKQIMSRASTWRSLSRMTRIFSATVMAFDPKVVAQLLSCSLEGKKSESELRQVFTQWDLDGDGFLSKDEIKQALSGIGNDDGDITMLLNNMPEPEIDFYTFMEMALPDLRTGVLITELCKNKLADDDVKRCFAAMDKKRTGFVDRDSLKDASVRVLTSKRDLTERCTGEMTISMSQKSMSFQDFRRVAQEGLNHQISKWFSRRLQVHSSGEIMCISSARPDSLDMFIYELERQHGVPGNVKYVISYEERVKMWQIVSISVEGSMQSRSAFPVKWRGLKGKALSSIIGVEGRPSVSRNGTVGMHEKKEGAIAMASRALSHSAGVGF